MPSKRDIYAIMTLKSGVATLKKNFFSIHESPVKSSFHLSKNQTFRSFKSSLAV
jgi:hypothetical protein